MPFLQFFFSKIVPAPGLSFSKCPVVRLTSSTLTFRTGALANFSGRTKVKPFLATVHQGTKGSRSYLYSADVGKRLGREVSDYSGFVCRKVNFKFMSRLFICVRVPRTRLFS